MFATKGSINMQVKDLKDWKMVRFNDRGILPKDLQYFSTQQKNDFFEVEVVPTSRKGVYKVAACESGCDA